MAGDLEDPFAPVTIVVSTGGHYATVERFAVTAVTTSASFSASEQQLR